MMGMKLIATGRALPGRALSNEDMTQFVETSDEWISSRTGIHNRYFCDEGESATTLACAAAKQALDRSGIAKEEVGCVLCGTTSAEHSTPSMACFVHGALGLPEDIPSADISAACSGFLYALEAARGLLLCSGGKRYALVVGCDQMSSLLDMSDRTTCVLFGDGAGAAVFALDADAEYAALQGTRMDTAISVGGTGMRQGPIKMNGSAVYRFAVEIVPMCVEKLLAKTGHTMDDVDWVICHQANERIIDAAIRRLKAPKEKFYKNIGVYANTSSGSVPIALDEMIEKGLLKPGQRIIMVGFGGGLTWGAVMMRV